MNITDNSSDICNEGNTVVLSDAEDASRWLWNSMDQLIITIILPEVSAVGILGNAVFLLSIVTLKRMQTSLNAYLCNLAISDILFLLTAAGWSLSFYIVTPISLATSVSSIGGCIAVVFTSFPWYFASIGFITLISIERYLAIGYPLKHMVMKGAARTAKICATVWTLSLLVTACFIPRYYHHERCIVWPQNDTFNHLPTRYHICTAMTAAKDLAVSVNLIELAAFILALITNTVLYILIIKILSSRSIAGQVEKKLETDAVRNQAARTLIINGIVFFLCQAPLRVATLDFFLDNMLDVTHVLNRQQYSLILTVSRGCLLLNSCINPFLYFSTSVHYRRAIYDTFKKLIPRFWHYKSGTKKANGMSISSSVYFNQSEATTTTVSTNMV